MQTAQCTNQPQACGWPRILMGCVKIQTPQNRFHYLCHPLVGPTCHHVTIVTICPPIMLTSLIAPQNVVALTATLKGGSCSCSCSQGHNDDDQHSNWSPCPCYDINYVDTAEYCDIDHSKDHWDTNPDENPYHPVHFDGRGFRDNPITPTYKVDYESSNKLHISGKPPEDAPCAFDVKNYTKSPEQK